MIAWLVGCWWRLAFRWRFRGVRIEFTETPCRAIRAHAGHEPGLPLTILDYNARVALVEVRIGHAEYDCRPFQVPLGDLRPAPDVGPTPTITDRLFRAPLDNARSNGAG